jgi:hypothetical protein
MNRVLKQIIVCSLFLFGWHSLFAAEYALYLNRDTATVNGQLIHSSAFNWTEEWSMQNAILTGDVDEELVVTVFNLDTVDHTFTIEGVVEVDNLILAQSSAEFTFQINSAGTFRYYSDRPEGKLLGASGHLLIGYQDYSCFYWNLFDLEHELTAQIGLGEISEIPVDYKPELFFINGLFFPETLEDPFGYVSGTVGEEIIISIVNSGNMDHILHFHGYHIEILEAKRIPNMIGWSKDSLPVKQNEALTLLLVPNQTGVYPVHDHNLISVTNVGFYPGGMITHLNITE